MSLINIRRYLSGNGALENEHLVAARQNIVESNQSRSPDSPSDFQLFSNIAIKIPKYVKFVERLYVRYGF